MFERVPKELVSEILSFTFFKNTHVIDSLHLREVCKLFANAFPLRSILESSKKMFNIPALQLLNKIFDIATCDQLKLKIVEEALGRLKNVIQFYVKDNHTAVEEYNIYTSEYSKWSKRWQALSTENNTNEQLTR